MTTVSGDVSRRERISRALRRQLLAWLVVVINAASLFISLIASNDYDRYADALEGDCGRLVSMPLLIVFVMWLAFAMAAASIPLAVGWYRHRQRARGLRWFPVRGIGLALACLGALCAVLCYLNFWSLGGPYHVFCSNI
jgi:hypothetical protein